MQTVALAEERLFQEKRKGKLAQLALSQLGPISGMLEGMQESHDHVTYLQARCCQELGYQTLLGPKLSQLFGLLLEQNMGNSGDVVCPCLKLIYKLKISDSG